MPRSARIRTSDVEPPAFNVTYVIQRQRFGLILSLLPNRRFSRLLEIGYGSGIFLPELAQRCDELYGIDIHPHAARVLRNLRRHRVDAELLCGSASALPFNTGTFDCIVAVSCLEYMDSLDCVAREIKRVLRSDGSFVFVTPGNSFVIDLVAQITNGRSVRKHYGERRDSLIPTLKKSFVVQRELTIPRTGRSLFTAYRGMRLGVY